LNSNPKAEGFWTVPSARNPHFTGRDDVLKTLRENLLQSSTAALTQPQAISGLGGIGKTQTAVEYAYRHRNDYSAVFWVRADSTLELSRGFVMIAKALDLPQANAQDEEAAVQAATRWLNTQTHWLLIFDNADEPELLRSFSPQNTEGHILVTSRAQDLQDLGITKPVEIKVLLPEEALTFLLERTGRSADDNPAEHRAAKQLAEELGYLPLALEQAAVYVVTQKALFHDYLASYRTLKLKRLEKAKPKFGNYPESVATTWLLNFRQVEQISEASADLLRFSAFLDPDVIPFELIVLGASQFGETLEQALDDVAEDPLILNELLSPLGRYSLIRVDPNAQAYSIHRLVQEVLKAEMEAETLHRWLERAIKAVNQAFPSVEFKDWPLCERLLPHVTAVAGFENIDSSELQEVGFLFNQAGVYSKERGLYILAETLLSRSLEILERQLGADHPDVAASLNNLAGLYDSQGRYSAAEPLYGQSLEILERQLGADHPAVAVSLNNLAALHRTQGRFSKAEPLYVRSLEILERQLGADHLDVATSLNNLAALYRAQGRYSEAEPLYVRSLEILERQLGADHPDVATSLNNLAGLYDSQGRYSEAEPLYVRSLEIRERQLGADHPSVAASLNNLAGLHRTQGRYSAAKPLYVRSLEILERQLGVDHPDVATSLNNLAGLYDSQGRYSEAEPLYLEGIRILSQFSKNQGFEHPNFQAGLQNFYGFLAQIMQEKRQTDLSPATQALLNQAPSSNTGVD
jgi:Flp pilus assembly protein TadD